MTKCLFTQAFCPLIRHPFKQYTDHSPFLGLDVLCHELNQKIHLKTDSIIEFVESKFSTSYTKSGMTTLLHRLGYVYKKPKLIPSVPDEDIQEWFVEHYHDFMASKSENVAVFFMDATHPEHNAQAA